MTFIVRSESQQKSDGSVQRTMTAIDSFTNPFSVEPSKLVNCSSGAAVPPEVEKMYYMQIKQAKNGKIHSSNNVLQRRSFFLPVHQLELKTIPQTSESVKLRSRQNKVTELKQQGNIDLQLLFEISIRRSGCTFKRTSSLFTYACTLQIRDS